MIVDLVLETEQYIEKVKQIVCDYKISNRGIKDKIMKEVCDSTYKEMVESHLNKSTIGKKILKLIQGQKQEEELKNSYLTKLLSKANKIYEKAYNKYKGYDNLSEKEIAKIAEYAYQRLLETDEDKSKRDLYNESTSKKLYSGAEDMKVIEEFVKSKGYTVEDYPSIDFHEINQSIGVQTQQEEEPETMINVSYHYNINPLMAFAAAALLGAMHYMTQYDSEVLHHGFGPSGL